METLFTWKTSWLKWGKTFRTHWTWKYRNPTWTLGCHWSVLCTTTTTTTTDKTHGFTNNLTTSDFHGGWTRESIHLCLFRKGIRHFLSNGFKLAVDSWVDAIFYSEHSGRDSLLSSYVNLYQRISTGYPGADWYVQAITILPRVSLWAVTSRNTLTTEAADEAAGIN